MDRQPALLGALVRLRPLGRDDREALYTVASDPLAVEDAVTGALVGSSRFQNHDDAEGGSVEIGWTFLARSHWRSGANREMKRLMLDHAFASVARVYFTVGETNLRSRHAVEGIGARWTGAIEERSTAGRITRHMRYVIERRA
ncbi:GNAT family N-acetyltransferase [Croceicoccus bisphenolivorans]|uniref:GNAT family N-acetyltransferase n=1 Tax=Croceicoccus bisphenolivorans TaxID=1783232 RepID=UPI000831475A|nr:GNAT family protein [Croceicoccus bisphenolivorans]